MKKIIIFVLVFLTLFTFAHARVVSPEDCANNPNECLIYDTGANSSQLRQASGTATLSNGVWTASANNDKMYYDWIDSSGGSSGVVTIELDARFEQCGAFTDSFYSFDNSDSTANSFIWLRPGNSANKWSFRDNSGSYTSYGTCSSGVWYTLRFEQNLTSDTIDFYVDDVLTGDDVAPRNNQVELDRFGFQLGTANYVKWANVTVYEGTNITRTFTDTISTNLKAYYNETPVLVDVNTSGTSFNYSLNGDSPTTVNFNSSTLSFTDVIQGTNNLSINENDYTFIFDNVSPSLNINSNLLSETYTVNFNNLINYSDSNLDSCLVFTQGINFSCNSNYTYSYNGNQSFNVTVSDLAGNSISNSNNILPIDPLFYVYFTNSTGGLIENFDINGTTYNKYFSENIYDYGLGSHTFLFEKLGFNSSEFELTFNTTSQINTTLSIPGAKLIFTFINVDDGSFIESEGTTTINLIGDEYSTTVSTTNRNYTLQSLEITNDTYQVIVSNPNYEAVNTLFDYTNQEVLEFNLYMTSTNLSDVADLIIEVQDTEGNVQKGITTQQYIWDTTLLESVLVNQKVTDTGGQTSYKVILDTRRYDFCAIYQGTQFCETDQVININTVKVVVQIDTSILAESSATNIYDVDFPYSLTNTTISENVSRVQFSYVNDQQDVDLYIIEIYESVNGSESKIYNDSSTSHSGLLKTDLNIGSGNLFKVVAKIELDGQTRILDSFYLNNEFLLQQATQSSGLDKLLTIAFMIIGVGIGLSKKVHSMPIAHIGLIISLGAITSFFPEILPLELFFFLAFVNVVSSLLITKRDDIGTTTNMRKIINSISVYIIFIFSLVFVLQALQTNGNLDDYGERTLNYLTNDGEKSSLETFIEESQQQIDQERLGTSPGGEDKTDNTLTTFIKIVGWAESFFDIMSKVFTIPETLYYLLDISSEFLGLIVSILNWALNIFIGFLFYREINK